MSFFLRKSKDKTIKKLSRILGFSPGNKELYKVALAHKSACTYTKKQIPTHNERLEFLGDAILDAIIADFVYEKYQDKDEGFLTKIRAKLVKRKNLDALSVKMGINKLVAFKCYNHNHKHVYGNALEALIGAIYLDKGYKKTKKFIIKRLINNFIDMNQVEADDTDYKSRLIEWGQKHRKEILFETFEKYSEQHHGAYYTAIVRIGGEDHGQGDGNSKKEAEQNAAEKSLIMLSEKNTQNHEC